MNYLRNHPLQPLNSFRTEAAARIFCAPKNTGELKQCLADFPREEKLILGGGCNILLTEDFNGLVIHPDMKGIRLLHQDDESVTLEVMAGEEWDTLVAHCVQNNWAGLENLSRIPGTAGAAPVQNIGAYGAEVKDCITLVSAIDVTTGETRSFTNGECQFAYRESIFKHNRQFIITSVTLELRKKYQYTPRYKELNDALNHLPTPRINDVREAVIAIRERKLPDHKTLPNAGSFFKNPYITKDDAHRILENCPELPVFPYAGEWVKTSAAFLIDQAGYKGKRSGNVGTYPNQPLIIVNYGTPHGNDIIRFMHEIQTAVRETFHIHLEPEVRIL